MQVSTSLHTDNHASTPALSSLQAGCPSCCPNSIKALKALLQCALKSANACISCSCLNDLEWRQAIGCTIMRPISIQRQSMHVLFGIQVQQQNSKTNWRWYSSKQFGLSLATNWNTILLPLYTIFHCMQTDVTDKRDSCLIAWTIHHTVCTDYC